MPGLERNEKTKGAVQNDVWVHHPVRWITLAGLSIEKFVFTNLGIQVIQVLWWLEIL
jgi:hypothetical protein